MVAGWFLVRGIPWGASVLMEGFHKNVGAPRRATTTRENPTTIKIINISKYKEDNPLPCICYSCL